MADRSQVRSYRVADCVVFRKTNERFGGLSNMASGFPLEVEGIRILTSEALYQACRFPHKPEVQRLVIQQASPMTAKMKSKPHRKNTRSDWEKVRVKIMRWCLRVKLAQNWQKFSELLLATGDRPIVEESRKDDFWGAKAADEERLVGLNVLGRLLMELREEVRTPNGEHLKRIEPPSIPQFILYGRPIGFVEADGRGQTDAELFGEPPPGRAEQGVKAPSTTRPYSQAPAGEPKKELVEPKVAEETRSTCMIPKDCKRLAEVDFPIAVVGGHSLAEKARRMGTPHQLHLWWAWRPLAACRAMLLAMLFPDPCDPLCPEGFKQQARHLLPQVQGKVGTTDEDLHKSLLKFIGDFANWDLAAHRSYLEVSRALVKAAYGDPPPLVVDPFAGGGSIPLEALRLGCDAFASDLNPVACLIEKAKLIDIPRHEPVLAEELRRVGAEIKRQAEKDLADLYPEDPDGATPIAYLWARTVRCESPNCGAEIPLVRSFWLCRKANRKWALQHRVVRPRGEPPRVEFELVEPTTEKDVPAGTVTRAKAACVACGAVLPPERVRAHLATQRGGADAVFDAKGRRAGGARMLAVVTIRPGEQGRHYRLPAERDYEAVHKAQERLGAILGEWERGGRQGHCPVPDEPLPPIGTLGFRVQRYGMLQWGDLFTARQSLTLTTLASHASATSSEASRELIALSLSKLAERNNSICDWMVGVECPGHLYTQQVIPPAWDFAEAAPLGGSSGSFELAVEHTAANAAASNTGQSRSADVGQSDAAELMLPDESVDIYFTDPPYYNAVPYSDLSDFFYVWLKRTLVGHSLLRDQFDPSNPLTPKHREVVQDETKTFDGRVKDRTFFENRMAKSFACGRSVLKPDGIGCVVFAHKTTEGWEALLTGMISGAWVITGSWPIATERSARMRARDSAALESSVHLICRPRPEGARVGDWAEVLRELPNRVGDWMERLQGEGIRGADLVFACIGPALEIFSRYTRVETAEGREVALAEYLEKVWEVVGRSALAQVLGTTEAKARNGAAGAVEEDARLTALFLWTLQSTTGETGEGAGDEDEDEEPPDDEDEEGSSGGKAKGFTLVFDVVRRFAQPLGINLPKWEGRIIETKKGVVRLLPIAERARQLFGREGADAMAARFEEEVAKGARVQLTLFPDESPAAPTIRGRSRGRGKRAGVNVSDESIAAAREATTLDRIHAAMLLQASGRTNALRALLRAEQEGGPDFLRLANALSALYPKGSEEKRLLDAMLLAVPR